MFIIYLNYLLITSIDLLKENALKLAKERSIWYLAQTITDVDYTDDIALMANKPAQAKSQINNLKWGAGVINLYVKYKTVYICFNQRGDIYTQKRWSFETDGQVHLPLKQRLIHQERYQHATSKGMDS